jgi:excisionase family DNA binding protein
VSISNAYVSSAEAAQILGIHRYTIQKLLRSGRIPAEKIVNRWLIQRAAAEDYAKTYVPKVGRPRQKRKYARRKQA